MRRERRQFRHPDILPYAYEIPCQVTPSKGLIRQADRYKPMVFPIVIAADCFSKLCTAVMINTLPYARKEEESKIKLVYSKVRTLIFVLVGVITLVPFFFLKDASFCFAMIPAVVTAIGLRFFLKLKIGGYTGDCCGASVLIIEQVFYLSVLVIWCRHQFLF